MHTPHCYSPGQAAHNAEVFVDLWRHDILGVDPDVGEIFEMSGSGGSAGNTSFRELVRCIRDTDKLNKLSLEDRIATAAMVLHLSPPLQPIAD